MAARPDLHDHVVRRTQLGGQPGLEIVPVGVLLLVFGVGELGWRLGPWFLPALGVTAMVALLATVTAIAWRRRRYGLVKLRWDHRVTVLVVLVAVAYVAITISPVADPAQDTPIYLRGVALGLLVAALSLWRPYALAQHLVFGVLLAGLSLLPLGAWVDMPVPPYRTTELTTSPHPLAVLQPLIVPSWLILTGIVGHLRLARAFAQPVPGGDDHGQAAG